MNFAIACGHIDTNPTRNVKSNRRPALTRFLSRDEIGRLRRMLDEQAGRKERSRQQADIIRLLLLTGCRRGEIVRLRWSEVGHDALVLGDSKTGRERSPSIPRPGASSKGSHTAEVRSCFRRRSTRLVHVAPSSTSGYLARREAGIEDVRLHDLRHTHASHAVMNGVPVPVVLAPARPQQPAHDAALRPSGGSRDRGCGRKGGAIYRRADGPVEPRPAAAGSRSPQACSASLP